MLPGGLRAPDPQRVARSPRWTRLPLVPVRNARIAALAAFIAGSAAALWVLWGPMLSHAGQGGSVRLCLKNFYVPDQYSVMSIGRLVQDGLSPYQEPYSATGDSVYPSEYYRVLGLTARATDTSVVWAWNVVGLCVSLALLALAVAWARRMAPGTRAWVLAPVPFLVGTLYWWGSGEWLYSSGQAVLWPAVASLYSPGAEGPAVLMAGASLLLLALALAHAGRRAAALAAAAGALGGASLQLHANVAVLVVTATALALVADAMLTTRSRRRRAIAGGLGAALVLVALVTPGTGVAVRLVLLLIAIAAVALSDADWRRARGLTTAAWAGAAIVASLPLSARLADQTLSGEGYFYDRQSSVSGADVDLSLIAVLGLLAPVWVLAAAVGRHLWRNRAATPPGWLPVLAGLTSATLLLTMAGRLGTEGLEWHRFLVYGSFLTVTAAVPGLWLMLASSADRGTRVAGAVSAALLAATLPATIAFADDQRGVITCTPPQEAEAFAEIGRLSGGRLLLMDRCFAPGPLRVHSGARVAYFNAGIAPPEDQAATERAHAEIVAGRLPGATTLARMGVSGFLTNTQCAGAPRERIAARFGTPIAQIPLRDGEELGLPPGLIYEIYEVPPLGESPARAG